MLTIHPLLINMYRLNVLACFSKNRVQVSVVLNALVLVVVMLKRSVTVSELPSMEVMRQF